MKTRKNMAGKRLKEVVLQEWIKTLKK